MHVGGYGAGAAQQVWLNRTDDKNNIFIFLATWIAKLDTSILDTKVVEACLRCAESGGPSSLAAALQAHQIQYDSSGLRNAVLGCHVPAAWEFYLEQALRPTF